MRRGLHGRFLLLLIVIVATSPVCVYAQGDVAAFVRRLATSTPLDDAVWGVEARTLGGEEIVSYNAGINMTPASTAKVLTCGAALHALGTDYRYATRIGYSGVIEDGRLKGDLYIIGGADPTTGAADWPSVSSQSVFAKWSRIIAAAGINAIDGRIIGDGRMLDCKEIPGWDTDDTGFYYGAVPGGLNYYENAIDYRVTPGQAVGDSVSVVQTYPQTPWLVMSNSSVTGPAGTGDKLSYVNSDLFPAAEMRGSYAIGKPSRTESCTNRFGAYTCAWHFREYLSASGIETGPCADIGPQGDIRTDLTAGLAAGGATSKSRAGATAADGAPAVVPDAAAGAGVEMPGNLRAAPQDSLTILGETLSPPLESIVREVLHRSDNFYAETIFRTLGLEYTASAAYDSCRVAQRRVLSGMGLDSRAVRIQDGSGLSRKNFISPAFFVDFLSAMSSTEVYDIWLDLFPKPGEGTLYDRMSLVPYDVKSRIRIKSGSMDGVRAYCGYVLPPGGRGDKENTVVFSVITNNALGSESGAVKRVLDQLVALLVQQ